MQLFVSYEQEAIVSAWSRDNDPFPFIPTADQARLDHGFIVVSTKPLYEDEPAGILAAIGPIADPHANFAIANLQSLFAALKIQCKLCGKDY